MFKITDKALMIGLVGVGIISLYMAFMVKNRLIKATWLIYMVSP